MSGHGDVLDHGRSSGVIATPRRLFHKGGFMSFPYIFHLHAISSFLIHSLGLYLTWVDAPGTFTVPDMSSTLGTLGKGQGKGNEVVRS